MGDDAAVVTVRDEADGRSLHGWVRMVGDDVVVAVGGGDRPHIGCVVMAVPVADAGKPGDSPSISVLTIPPHKEEPIARAVAESVCRRFGRVAVVTAGVHEDDLDLDGIQSYLRLGSELATAVAGHLANLD